MKHIAINDVKCTGCSACANICPKKCIVMNPNSEGFIYPEIEEQECIHCGACRAVCSFENDLPKSVFNRQAYACFTKKEDIKKKSSSGGLFFEIAKKFIEKKGYVCGAEYSKDFSVKHTIVNELDGVKKLMKSKYIQSSMNDIFVQIKKYLSENKKILFIGTPCQVKGLKLYLKKDYDNLICGEVVCHGVPSYKTFKKYTDYISGNSEVTDVDFRNKDKGWKNYSVNIKFKDKAEYYESYDKCLYILGFINNLYLRKSCYVCNCKGDRVYADFTLGDLWGAEKIVPEIDDNTGVSLYISNTPKGEKILKDLSDEIFIKKLEDDKYLDYNPSIIKSCDVNNKRQEFFKNFDKFDFGTLWDFVHTNSKINKAKILLKAKIK